MWRAFNRRLNDLFGRRGGGGNGSDGGGPRHELPSGRAFGGGAGVLIALVIAVWLASGFYIVDASQRAIVLTFGKYSEQTSPGLPRWSSNIEVYITNWNQNFNMPILLNLLITCFLKAITLAIAIEAFFYHGNIKTFQN